MFGLADLIASLHVEQLDKLLFRGTSLPLDLPRVFGGQVLAQALNSAVRTVEPNRLPHSLHAYFLRPGNADRPIIYEVDPIRDGGSFSTRRVVARQNGEAIFNTAVSFHKREQGLDHQMDLPDGIPEPQTLEPDIDRAESALRDNPDAPRPFFLPKTVIDVRSVSSSQPGDTAPKPPEQGFWFRFARGVGEDPVTHQTLLAYISDYRLMGTGLRPHGMDFSTRRILGASLDHAMWFHGDVRVDGWIFHSMDSPRAARARNFNRGSFYDKNGTLIASCAQEGLVRLLD
ncbi:acyl-CoA thioesterase [Parvularcula oceani]|uniref:acyl-CoA thioesterase n=1 Tax=Parvularcula oceani TaxID=1247963 RepID=UPI0004E0E7BE|nr:acyl-CoA thioesterase II [Parvularcula oceani]